MRKNGLTAASPTRLFSVNLGKRAFAPHRGDYPLWGFLLLGPSKLSKNVIEIGILFSRSGPYAELGEQGFRGAMAGIDEVNRRGSPFALAPAIADPQGNADRYAVLASDLIKDRSLQHVVGCTTSWSRKEVIPVMEKTQALLWYPCVYEGFEANENVVYVGACANQHILLLLEHVLPTYGRNAFLLGSNYVWGWETCRLARDVVTRSGGTVLGERHIPIGDTDIDRIIEEIRLRVEQRDRSGRKGGPWIDHPLRVSR